MRQCMDAGLGLLITGIVYLRKARGDVESEKIYKVASVIGGVLAIGAVLYQVLLWVSIGWRLPAAFETRGLKQKDRSMIIMLRSFCRPPGMGPEHETKSRCGQAPNAQAPLVSAWTQHSGNILLLN